MKKSRETILAIGLILVGFRAGICTSGNREARRAVAPAANPPDSSSLKPRSTVSSANQSEALYEKLVTLIRDPESRLAGRANLFRALAGIGPEQIPELLARAQKLPLRIRQDLCGALLDHWFDTDAGSAGRWLHADGQRLRTYVAVWARHAPADALREMLAPGQMEASDKAIKTALEQLAGDHAQARCQLLASLPQSLNRDHFVKEALEKWGQDDPAAAWRTAQDLISGSLLRVLQQSLLEKWAEIDPVAAAQKARETFPNPKAGIFGNTDATDFADSLAEKNPAVALDFALSLSESVRNNAVLAAASTWAESAPLEALAWCMENGVDIDRGARTEEYHAYNSVLDGAMKKEPEKTLDWLRSLPQDPQRDRLIEDALRMQKDTPFAGSHP